MKNFVCFLVVFLFLVSCENGSSEQDCKQMLELQAIKLENLKTLSKLQHYGEGKSVRNVSVYLGKEDSVTLGEIVGHDERVIFYFSQYGCSSCYQPFWDKVIQHKNEWEEKMLILAFFESEKEFRIFMDGRDNGISVFRISERLHLFSDYDDYSYVFKTSSSLIVDNLLVLNHCNVEYMDDYLLTLSSTHSDSDNDRE